MNLTNAMSVMPESSSILQNGAIASCSGTVSHSANRHAAYNPLRACPRMSACRLNFCLDKPSDAISKMPESKIQPSLRSSQHLARCCYSKLVQDRLELR